MNIGEAADRSGISAKMIRHYEGIGLIPPARRSDGNYRSYDEADIHTLRFIRRARSLGFSMGQIADLLALWRDRGRASGQVKALALDHMAALQRRIDEMQAMVRSLNTLAMRCEGGARPDCPILDDLAAGDGGRGAQGPHHPVPCSRPEADP